MKSLAEQLKSKNYDKEYFKHPRHKYIDLIYQRINTERKDTKYKPLSKKVIAIKTSLLSLDELDYLVKKAQNSSNFSKTFFGMIKVRK